VNHFIPISSTVIFLPREKSSAHRRNREQLGELLRRLERGKAVVGELCGAASAGRPSPASCRGGLERGEAVAGELSWGTRAREGRRRRAAAASRAREGYCRRAVQRRKRGEAVTGELLCRLDRGEAVAGELSCETRARGGRRRRAVAASRAHGLRWGLAGCGILRRSHWRRRAKEFSTARVPRSNLLFFFSSVPVYFLKKKSHSGLTS
jgi:hypothetical protein